MTVFGIDRMKTVQAARHAILKEGAFEAAVAAPQLTHACRAS
jgi:hypothetical protein